MTRPDYTHVILIIDRSGSMAGVRDDAQGGINTVFKDLADDRTIGKVTATLTDFDTAFTTHTRMTPVSDVPFYTLHPRGATALLDAVAREIIDSGADLSKLEETDRPSKVLVYIVTDGMENASREWTLDKVKELIKDQSEKYSWNFSFIGADAAAWAGNDLGINSVSTYTPSAVGTRSVYTSLRTNIVSNTQSPVFVAMPDVIEESLKD